MLWSLPAYLRIYRSRLQAILICSVASLAALAPWLTAAPRLLAAAGSACVLLHAVMRLHAELGSARPVALELMMSRYWLHRANASVELGRITLLYNCEFLVVLKLYTRQARRAEIVHIFRDSMSLADQSALRRFIQFGPQYRPGPAPYRALPDPDQDSPD